MTMKLPTALLLGLMTAAPSYAQEQASGTPDAAGRIDAFHSTDSDGVDISKAGLEWDFRYVDQETYSGIRAEHARFDFRGRPAETANRLFVRLADRQSGESPWKWNAMLGTDGHQFLGNGAIYRESARGRQEYFFERDQVETPMGIDQGLYSTFVGAAYDLPLNDRNTVTGLVGYQDFSGNNRRLHLRGRYIHSLRPDWGLSAQLRVRYFHNSDPYEYDYYSPKWYAEVLPVIQLRRFHKQWQYLGAVGIGRQKDSANGWFRSNYAEFFVTSPVRRARDWYFKAGVIYRESPTNAAMSGGRDYRYTQFTLDFTKRF